MRTVRKKIRPTSDGLIAGLYSANLPQAVSVVST